MDVFEAVRTRRSIRRYEERPVEEEKLQRVLEAGRLSPSAANRQPWHFIVVREASAKERLRSSYGEEWFAGAPVIIVVCADPSLAWRRRDGEEVWKIDAAIALQTMVLCAWDEGLGTCWICAFDEKAAKEALGIPNGIRVVAMTPLGYPAERKEPVTQRKRLNEIVHYERW
ncbi:MAG: nitroreductase family protein [Candidatus Brockarchaeota archaeon]|nr:nitroreductase family protein [Candidatus Brockarchaeota archaeon]